MEYCKALPTLPSQNELVGAVVEILAEAAARPPSRLTVADALIDVVWRGLGSYLPCPPDTEASIERWAAESWSSPGPELADALAVLLINTDSGVGRRVLTEASLSSVEAVRRIAQDALREMGRP